MLEEPVLTRRRLVLVGDYVNRGPASKDVIDLLIREKDRRGSDLVLLTGNHERALLDYLNSGDFVRFARYGGMATIRSYVGLARGDVRAQLESAMPQGHVRLLLEELRLFVETDELLVSHAGYDPANDEDRSLAAMTSSHPEMFREDRSRPRKQLVVCGHYVQSDRQPAVLDGLICLDTGCGTVGGPLTALLLPERRLISV